MFEEEIVIIDTPNDTDPAEPVEPAPQGETAEEKANRLEETNKKLYARLKTKEGFIQDADGKWIKPVAPKKIITPERPVAEKEFETRMSKLELSEKKRQFGFRNGLSPEETDKLFKFAGDEDPNVALKDEFFQAGLKTFRQKQNVKDAIPSSSNRSRTVVEGKTFAEMTPEERKKNWGKVTGAAK